MRVGRARGMKAVDACTGAMGSMEYGVCSTSHRGHIIIGSGISDYLPQRRAGEERRIFEP